MLHMQKRHLSILIWKFMIENIYKMIFISYEI